MIRTVSSMSAVQMQNDKGSGPPSSSPSPPSSSSYTVVDVKFEAGDGGASQELISQFVREEEADRIDSCEDSINKRKRKVPQKLSIDEDGEVSDEEFDLDMSAVVKVEYSDGGVDESYQEDIAVPDSEQDLHDNDENIALIRANNQQYNCKQRDDCPVCGDKANGLHYGIYSCEGCKNFFKRSVVIVQTKPYVCPNQNNCDVRIVYDKSGIKRKGARCQSCRYTACLDAGMSHPGFPRTRGGRHRAGNDQGNKIAKIESLSSIKDADDNSMGAISLNNYFDESSWDNYNSNNDITSSTWDSLNDQLSGTADNISESIQRDDVEKEKSINRELQARLMEKENQLKISEKQNEKLKRHMMTTNTLVKIQQEQIKRLKLDLSKLTNNGTNAKNGCEPQQNNHHLSSIGFNSVSTTDSSSHGLTNRIDSSSQGLTNRMVTNNCHSSPENA